MICLHFYHGEGYNPDFIAHLHKIIKTAEDGEEIIACSHSDDVCAMCPHLRGERCLYKTEADEEIREMDRKALALLEVKSGDRMKWSDIKGKIPYLFNMWFQAYCLQCAWRQACEKEEMFSGFMTR